MSPFLMPQIESLRPKLERSEVVYLESGFHPEKIIQKLKLLRGLRSRMKNDAGWVIYSMYGSLHGFLVSLVLRKSFPVVNSFGGSDVLGSGNTGFTWFIRDLLTKALSLWTAKRVDHIVVKNAALKKYLQKRTDTDVSVIPNGVNLNVFKESGDKSALRLKLGWHTEEFVVLFNLRRGNSQLESVKNYPLALEVIEEVKRLVPAPVRLEIIAHKTQEEVNELFHAGDCLLLTSKHEGSPNIVKEAMACNLPIVTVDCGDVKKRLATVSNSYVCESYAPGEIANCCHQVFLNAHRTNGRTELVKQKLDSENVAKRLIALFADTCPK